MILKSINELIKMYNISTFYPYVYEEKFKKTHFLHTDSGWIKNNKNIYLNLEDLNMIEDLGHILDFYRKIEKEGNTYRISICVNCEYKHQNHVVSYTCSDCQTYTLEPLVCINNKEVCYNCYNCCKNDVIFYNILYTKPVMENFNLYEWVPINGFLENRNINCHLYKRKMSIEFNDNFIKLRLLNYDSVNVESDYMLRMFEKLYVNENLSNNIFKKIGLINKNYKNEETKEYKEYTAIIISK